MEVRICALCISSEMIQNFNIKLSDVNCIWDLKKILELKLSVAACDQRIYFKERLLEDSKSLSSLYVKKGDSFNVEFLACCNIENLRSVLHVMKTFLETVCESYSGLETVSTVTEDRNKFVDYCQDVYDVLHLSSNELFVPWENPTSVANRHYFTQEGGLDILSSIYKFAQKTFRLTEKHPGVEETEMFQTVTYHQKLLEYSCLGTLWNYSELEEGRKIVLTKISLDMFIKSLIRSPSQEHEGDLEPDVVNINNSAVGCLAQYLEMPDIQQFVAEHYIEAVTKLVWLSSNSTSSFHKEVAAKTLFCCSIHPKAALKLLENKVHQLVITKMKPLLSISDNNENLGSNLSTAMQYFFCLFLANIESLPDEKIPTDQQKIDEVIEKFLSLHTPSEVGEYEMAYQYVWISMAKYVQLALSSCNVKTLHHTGQATQQFSSAGKVGLFSLCHLTKSRINRELFKKEKLVDYLVCICWFAKKCEGNSLVPELTEFEKIEPPRLQSIAKAYLAKCYGHRIT